MQKKELEQMLGYEITMEGWDILENMYMGCKLDKEEFIKVINAKKFRKVVTTDIYTPDRYSKGGYEYVRKYEWYGYGCDAQSIYVIKESKFNIRQGIIYTDVIVGYCTRDKKEYKGYIR